MKRVRTHYDNLQVARNADPSVVTAAYRSLSFKHHPDRNKGGGRSEEIMRILNQSYAVLSDPLQRLAHDQWIEKMEAKGRAGQQDIRRGSQACARANQQPDEDPVSNIPKPVTKTAEFAKQAKVPLVILGIASIAAFVFSEPRPSGLPRYEAAGPDNGAEAVDEPLEAGTAGNDLPISPGEPNVEGWTADVGPSANGLAGSEAIPGGDGLYMRPAKAPNGAIWPTTAGYVSGYPRLRSGGLSTVIIDNSSNTSDVFVKLVSIDAFVTRPVRQIFIPASGSFTISGLKAGEYDVRYQDLNDGSLSRSESFILKETRESTGVRFSNFTLTLYKVTDGNMQTFPLAESEF